MAAAVEVTPAIIPTARRVPDRFRTLAGTVAAIAPLVLVVIVVILFQQAAPAVRHFGLGFLAGTDWNPVTDTFGALPAIFGTVATSFVALSIGLPVGVAVAVVLAEQGQTTIRGILGTGIELLAAIPSVVYGICALYVLAPWSYQHLEVPISDRFGFIGWLSPPAVRSLFSASLVLAVMLLPPLSPIPREAIHPGPRGLKESAVALGATWWETTWRVILPSAPAGTFGATTPSLG